MFFLHSLLLGNFTLKCIVINSFCRYCPLELPPFVIVVHWHYHHHQNHCPFYSHSFHCHHNHIGHLLCNAGDIYVSRQKKNRQNPKVASAVVGLLFLFSDLDAVVQYHHCHYHCYNHAHTHHRLEHHPHHPHHHNPHPHHPVKSLINGLCCY